MTSFVGRSLVLSLGFMTVGLAVAIAGEDSADVQHVTDRQIETDVREGSAGTISEEPITDYDRDHWAFQPISRPDLPNVNHVEWPNGPVDRFILSELERADISPMHRADRVTLLRRLKFDVLGLPPTPREVLHFERSETPEADYRLLVDHMLASPAYGERWAQYWLDLARFAETDGFEFDTVRKDAWKYRQWVIDSLNNDVPYNEFVGLQLAGDLTGRAQDAIATMFCMAGPDMPDINEQDLRRHDKLNEITSTVGATLLGLQMHCAQCHDHKYDPISQADFYRLRSFFETAVPVMERDKAVVQLSAQPEAIASWLYFRGDLNSRGPAVTPRPPRIACLSEQQDDFPAADVRRALVNWLFAEENPLTARVVANRVWQHHFGTSLCENPSDLGVVAGGPTHPELLDWLASELRQSGWSLKHLHRTILLSATYQQASREITGDPASAMAWQRTLVKDRDNKLYSRFTRKRLEGEVIRDALLAVSGQLNGEQGGPSVMPPLPEALLATLLKGQWSTSENPADHVRRSIYVFARRNLRYPIFDVFDRPDASLPCARRDCSTTAIQSLQMLNSEITFQSALHLRDRLLSEQAPSQSQPAAESLVEQLFLTGLSRRPRPEEKQPFVKVLSSRSMQLPESLLAACVAVLNSSEFVYVD